MDNIEKFVLFAISSIGVILVACVLGIVSGCSKPEASEPHTPSAMAAQVKQASHVAGTIYIQVVIIDGEEYLLAETYRGVSICKK